MMEKCPLKFTDWDFEFLTSDHLEALQRDLKEITFHKKAVKLLIFIKSWQIFDTQNLNLPLISTS